MFKDVRKRNLYNKSSIGPKSYVFYVMIRQYAFRHEMNLEFVKDIDIVRMEKIRDGLDGFIQITNISRNII